MAYFLINIKMQTIVSKVRININGILTRVKGHNSVINYIPTNLKHNAETTKKDRNDTGLKQCTTCTIVLIEVTVPCDNSCTVTRFSDLYRSLHAYSIKDNVIHNMAWWLKSAGALNFALSQEQCPISL